MRIIGIDPGLQRTGWGVLEAQGNRLSAVACGVIRSEASDSLAERLTQLYRGLVAVLEEHRPEAAAVEETFVNMNPASTLKLGSARAVALLVPALAGLPVAEYQPSVVKKSLVGTGAADKSQMVAMIQRLMPGLVLPTADAADAMAVAICHAHNAQTAALWGGRAVAGAAAR